LFMNRLIFEIFRYPYIITGTPQAGESKKERAHTGSGCTMREERGRTT
jgi:hypothetical protein